MTKFDQTKITRTPRDKLSGTFRAGANSSASQTRPQRVISAIFFIAWFVVVALEVAHHVMWRDEVRAFSFALKGNNIIAMARAVHGDGHPLLWYVLLRSGYALFHIPQVLPALAFLVALAAALLLVFVSPFPWPVVGLILSSYYFLFEYSVEARNYGITMLMMFLLAAYYRRGRPNGIVMGGLLFLLANCNVHSVVLAGTFQLFWLSQICLEEGFSWSFAMRQFAIAALIAFLGVVLCVATVFPTFNDAVVPQWHQEMHFLPLVLAVADPAGQSRFGELAGVRIVPSLLHGPVLVIIEGIASFILYGSTLGLLRRPEAFLAALSSLIILSLFFTLIYAGSYRHDGLWFSFLIALYWICWDRPQEKETANRAGLVWMISQIGFVFFVILLAIQAIRGVANVAIAAESGIPRSQSAAFAAFIKQHPDLSNAILIADPDYILEPMPYYLNNPTYLMRQQKYGNVVIFTKHARLDMSLSDILAEADGLHGTTGRPVVVLLQRRLEAGMPPATYAEGYNWTFSVTPDQVKHFLQSTVLLKHFAPASTDESYDAYLLKN